ncbi:MAG: diphthamide synthesis protein [Nanoarchaeota archaeon]|nr:diphthamide synthesis protein [Nanoarchaeota archaeon]
MKISDYDLEIDRVKEIIKQKKPKSVLIQLPDGLKPYATKIADEIGGEVYIWAGSCFGACDIPKVDVDMIIQFGHIKFRD